MLSGPGLGQGSGKVFGNIGGPITLKIYYKESKVKKDPASSTRYKTSFPPKAGLDKGNFGVFLAFLQNLYTRRKTLPRSQDQAKKSTKLASQQNQASSKGILGLLSRNIS